MYVLVEERSNDGAASGVSVVEERVEVGQQTIASRVDTACRRLQLLAVHSRVLILNRKN